MTLQILDDELIKAALASREPRDISVIGCPDCGRFAYYNNGSSWFCPACEVGFTVVTEDEYPPECGRYVVLDIDLTLQDIIDAQCEDY